MEKTIKRATEGGATRQGQTTASGQTTDKQMELARTLLKTRAAGFTRKAGRTRTMGFVWFAYLVLSAAFLVIGPISLLANDGSTAGILQQIQMIMAAYWVVLLAAPVAIILAGISVFCAWRKHSYQLRTAILLSLSMVVGTAVSWLACEYLVTIKPIDLAILMTMIVAMPLLVKILIRMAENLAGKRRVDYRPNVVLQGIGAGLMIAGLVVLEVFAVQKVIEPIRNISEMYQGYKEAETTLEEMMKGAGESGAGLQSLRSGAKSGLEGSGDAGAEGVNGSALPEVPGMPGMKELMEFWENYK